MPASGREFFYALANVRAVSGLRLSFVEFPADDPDRARRFWSGLLGEELEPREPSDGAGWQTRAEAPAIGIHSRGRGPGDSFSLPYFAVSDIAGALQAVAALGGSVIQSRRAVGDLQGLRRQPLRAGRQDAGWVTAPTLSALARELDAA